MSTNQKGSIPLYLIISIIGILIFIFVSTIFPFKTTLFSTFFTTSSSFASGGTTYYVSPSGSDSNSGTSTDSPWQTINRVNSSTFLPRDQILFQGGDTFNGKIYLKPQENGTSANPIIFSSYGTGRATINSGSDSGLYSYNSQGFLISNLIFLGSGRDNNSSDGVVFYNDLSGDTKLDHIYLDNIDVSGYGKNGISIGGWNGDSAYSNIKIINATSHDNLLDGIIIYAQNSNANSNVYVGYASAYNNSGSIANPANEGGNGILLGSVDTGLIEHSIAYNNGSGNSSTAGPVGIWTYNSNNVTIQFNESYQNHTLGASDGDGFDLDQNVSNSILQYNYSHDNDGAGYLIAQPIANNLNSHNTIRYNISQNDARKLIGSGGIFVWGTTVGSEIYNNTIYISPSKSGLSQGINIANGGVSGEYVNGLHFRNNIIYTTGGVPFINIDSQSLQGATDLLFQNNDYYSEDGLFNIVWGRNSYSSLNDFQKGTNQEKINGVASGFSVDPGLIAPGTGGVITNTKKLNGLTAYQLSSYSQIIDKGLDLPSLYKTNIGTIDYFGNKIPQGHQVDIGANEFIINISPSPIQSPTITLSSNSTPDSVSVSTTQNPQNLPKKSLCELLIGSFCHKFESLIFGALQ